MSTGWKKPSAWINSHEADMVAEYYSAGHTVKQTAEHFGVNTSQVNNLAKKRGLTNGRKFFGIDADRAERFKRQGIETLTKNLAAGNMSYIGGYTSKDGSIRIRCDVCGHEFERTVSFIRKGNVICRHCEHEKAEAAKKQREEINKLQRELEKLFNPKIPKPKKNHYADAHEAFLNRTGICEICGKPYTVRAFVESCGIKYARDSGVCSPECHEAKKRKMRRLAHKGRRDSHRYRARKYGCEYDSSVNLKKLIKRDGLRCAICGEMCDPTDHGWTKDFGPLYPTIDHIIPMAKGGGHTWDNVQVAHAICNSYKSDKEEGVRRND